MSCSISIHLCKQRQRALGLDRFRHIYSRLFSWYDFQDFVKNSIFQFQFKTHLLMMKFKSQIQMHLFLYKTHFLVSYLKKRAFLKMHLQVSQTPFFYSVCYNSHEKNWQFQKFNFKNSNSKIQKSKFKFKNFKKKFQKILLDPISFCYRIINNFDFTIYI